MSKVAACIDLNPVRAELVLDPAESHFCCHAAAPGGEKQARNGYGLIYLGKDWKQSIRPYRICLYGKRLPEQGS